MEEVSQTHLARLKVSLAQDLDFHDQDSGYASHNFHSFPAKFPLQLPRKFIEQLTVPGEVILDPMMGSGTTVLEARLAGRHGVGFDIDPLALMLTKTKVTPVDVDEVARIGKDILRRATLAATEQRSSVAKALEKRWNQKTRDFVDYWFAPETQVELLALITEIEQIRNEPIKAFFRLAFSAIVITKSGGVSLAFDLAHTRPHRAKVVVDRNGNVILGRDLVGSPSRPVKLLTKTLRSPIEEFEKRIRQNLDSLESQSDSDGSGSHALGSRSEYPESDVSLGNSQSLPLRDESIDLIVTSPPYASNAIDYMRAHKFSLVWMGHSVDDLGLKRKEYIGGEAVTDFCFEILPKATASVVAAITEEDDKKGQVLHRYYSEMTRTLREMFRVLKPGKAAIVVVASSLMRGRDTETHTCLAEIGESIGFQVPRIGVRNLDRDRRMMPTGFKLDLDSQIQQRMHEEYVIGFCKPEANTWRAGYEHFPTAQRVPRSNLQRKHKTAER